MITSDRLDEIATAEAAREDGLQHRVCVCVAAGCLSSGSREVKDALDAEVEAAGLTSACQIKGVGCMGLCSQGPLVSLCSRKEGDEKEMVMYQNVTAEDAPKIVKALGKKPVKELLCPTDVPFFQQQTKIVLENTRPYRPRADRRLYRQRRLPGALFRSDADGTGRRD